MNRIEKYNAIIYSAIAGVIYFTINFKYTFSLTAPSDPLQYVLPSLYPELGFEFLDRIVLWLWIRFVANLPIPTEYIGGIATLLLTTITLIVGSWYLSKKVNMIAGSLFIFLYTLSPSILDISSYTYPMQMLTLVLLLTVVSVDYAKNINTALFLAGFGFIFIIFSKIQGYSFAFFILAYLIYYFKSLNEMAKGALFIIAGGVSAFILLFLTIYIIDGYEVIVNLFSSYFENSAQIQFKGRASGDFPPFYTFLLEPTAILAVLGMFIVWAKKEFFELRIIGLAAMFQLLGLMLIYFITARGGPVISNYVIDSYILGLIAISGVFGILLKDFKYKVFLTGFILFITYSSIVYMSIKITGGQSFYSPLYILRNMYDIYIALLCYVGILLLIFYFVFLHKSSLLLSALVIIVTTVVIKSDDGFKSAKFRSNYNMTYHDFSKQINNIADLKGPVWISIDYKHVKNGSDRLERVYKAFYNKKENLIFSQNKPNDFQTILTNRLDLFLQYSDYRKDILPENGKYNLKGKILASKINSASELNLKLGGIVGDCYLEVNDKNDKYLTLKPINKKDSFKVQLDYSKGSIKNGMINIVSDEVIISDEYIVQLFIQYNSSGKWKRKALTIKSGERFNTLSMTIPNEAKNVSYGWIVNAKNSSNKIDLPVLRLIEPNIFDIKLDKLKIIKIMEKEIT